MRKRSNHKDRSPRHLFPIQWTCTRIESGLIVERTKFLWIHWYILVLVLPQWFHCPKQGIQYSRCRDATAEWSVEPQSSTETQLEWAMDVTRCIQCFLKVAVCTWKFWSKIVLTVNVIWPCTNLPTASALLSSTRTESCLGTRCNWFRCQLTCQLSCTSPLSISKWPTVPSLKLKRCWTLKPDTNQTTKSHWYL